MYKTLEKGKRFCMNCITSLVGAKLGQRHAHRKNVKKKKKSNSSSRFTFSKNIKIDSIIAFPFFLSLKASRHFLRFLFFTCAVSSTILKGIFQNVINYLHLNCEPTSEKRECSGRTTQ